MKLMGSCNDVLCWLLDRSKSVPVFLNRGSTKLIPRTKCGHIYEIHCFCAKNRSNFHPFRHNLQISFATLNLTRANTLITVMHLWGIMEASGSRRYTQLQRGCHLSQLFTLVADDGTKISRSRVLMAGPKVDIRNGCAQSEGQRKKSESVRGGRGDGGGGTRVVISDEICATVIDHVLVQGNAMSGEGQGAEPNQREQTVSLWPLKVLEVSEFGTAQFFFSGVATWGWEDSSTSQQQEAQTVSNMLL